MRIRTEKTYLSVNASSNSSVVVTALSNQRVILYALVASAADTSTDFFLNDGATTVATLVRGVSHSGSPFILPYNDAGWVETSAGNALAITTGTGSALRVLATWERYGQR